MGDYCSNAYNALVCTHFAPEFGRQRVFQRPSEKVSERRRPGPGARGLTAFSQQVQFERGWYEGWTLQCTKITEDLDLDAFLAGLPEGALRLLVVPDEGGVRVLGADERAPSRRWGTGQSGSGEGRQAAPTLAGGAADGEAAAGLRPSEPTAEGAGRAPGRSSRGGSVRG